MAKRDRLDSRARPRIVWLSLSPPSRFSDDGTSWLESPLAHGYCASSARQRLACPCHRRRRVLRSVPDLAQVILLVAIAAHCGACGADLAGRELTRAQLLWTLGGGAGGAGLIGLARINLSPPGSRAVPGMQGWRVWRRWHKGRRRRRWRGPFKTRADQSQSSGILGLLGPQ